jgi:copper chaperone
MQEERKELIMQLAGVTGAGCVGAVREVVRRLDPTAEVEIDLEHKRATIRTFAQSLEVAEALNRAGFEATGMTL